MKQILIAMIQSIAVEYGIDPQLMIAIAQQESSLRPHVVGRTGDVGLFQLSPRTARAFKCNLKRLLEPAYNTKCAVKYLVHLRDKYATREPANWWTRYHSFTPKLRNAYFWKVIPKQEELYAMD